jgi:amino acid adenylation domain-containing protein
MALPNKASQADLLSKWKQRRKPVDRAIPARPKDQPVAATSGQRRLWLLQQLYPDSAFYQYGHLYKFKGQLQPELLELAFRQLLKRHDILRTNYHRPEDEVEMIIRREADFKLTTFDLTDQPAESRLQLAQQHADAAVRDLFDLGKDLLLRAVLLQLNEADHWLVISLHHIIGDRASLLILNDELYRIYAGLIAQTTAKLPELPVQYPDYAHWKNLRPTAKKSLDYWAEHLQDEPPVSALPFDRQRPAQATFSGQTIRQTLSPTVSAGIKAFAKELGTTANVVLLALYQILHLRYAAQKDITVGTPVSIRDKVELETMLGFLNETVVLRTHFHQPAESFRQFVLRIKSQVESALVHKDVSFDELVNNLQPQRIAGANPLFQNMFVFNVQAPAPALPVGLTVTDEMMDLGVSKFDLTLFATDHGDHFSLALEFAQDLFLPATAKRMLAHQVELIADAVRRPDAPITHLEILSAEERKTILQDWNQTATSLPRPASILSLIEDAAKASPTAIAVVDQQNNISYAALMNRADQLAAKLQPDTRIGLFADRSVEMVVGILGILRAGAAYVPLDPDYPAARRAYITEDASIDTIVIQQELQEKLVKEGIKLVPIPTQDAPTDWSPPELSPDNLAYLIYTSGSTGTAKGVAISHANLVHSTTARFAWFDHQPSSFLLLSSFAFDSSVAGIFWTLSQGGKLVLPPRRIEQDMDQLATLVARHAVSHTLLLPSLYQLLLEYGAPAQLETLRTVMVAGEACAPALVSTHFSRLPAVELVNEYGPTEGTVWCTAHKIQPVDATGPVPIGRPIPNVKNYVLDANLQPVPVGVPGELYLAGEGLAKEYWQRSELTAERFLEVDLGAVAGANERIKARLYKTGDLVKLRPSGVLDFLGRADQQVKIRGFRVELEEISRQLEQVPSVREAVTIVDQSGATPLLVAYYTVRQQLLESTLRQSLLGELPEYMVPAMLVELDELPRLPNGKINQRALPATVLAAPETSTKTFIAPVTATEKSLASVWEKVLKRGPVGLDDNYFAIGGDSIRSIRIISLARKEGLELKPHHIFTHQTVRDLAAALDREVVEDEARTVVPLRRTGAKSPLFCIHAGGGHVFFYQPLSNSLPEDRPVYAVQPHTLAGMDDLPEDIPAMAADYLREIRKVQPQGPYHLLGTCFSNCVVLEIAHQLLATGETVGSLFIIDSSPTQLAPVPVPRFSPVYTMLRIIREANWKLLRRSLYRYWFYTRQALSIPLEDEQGKALRQTINGLYQRYNEYTWSPIEHQLTLIRSTQFAENPEKKYHEENWSTLAGGGLKVRVIPGTHIGLFEPPYVEQLAATIEECLQEAPVVTAS